MHVRDEPGGSTGAQHAVGTGVIGGMLFSTFLAIFFVPVFFVVVMRRFRVKPVTMKVDETPADEPYASTT